MSDSQKINDLVLRDYWKLVIPLLWKTGLTFLFVTGEILLRNQLALPVYIDYYGTPSKLTDDVLNPAPLSLFITISFSLLYVLIFPVLSQGSKSNILNGFHPQVRKGILFWFLPKYWAKSVVLRIRTTLWPTLLFFVMFLIPIYTAPSILTFLHIPEGLSGDMIRLAFWVLGLSTALGLFGFYLALCSRWFLAPYLLSVDPDLPVTQIILQSIEYSKGARFYIVSYRMTKLPYLFLSFAILPAFYLLPYRNASLGLLASKLICRNRSKSSFLDT